MGQNNGTYGDVSYTGNSITIEIEPNTLGSVALTTSDARIECYWDGSQWVCNAVSFNQGQSANAA